MWPDETLQSSTSWEVLIEDQWILFNITLGKESDCFDSCVNKGTLFKRDTAGAVSVFSDGNCVSHLVVK